MMQNIKNTMKKFNSVQKELREIALEEIGSKQKDEQMVFDSAVEKLYESINLLEEDLYNRCLREAKKGKMSTSIKFDVTMPNLADSKWVWSLPDDDSGKLKILHFLFPNNSPTTDKEVELVKMWVDQYHLASRNQTSSDSNPLMYLKKTNPIRYFLKKCQKIARNENISTDLKWVSTNNRLVQKLNWRGQ